MMLRIKRVPTVVSNYQKDEAEETARRSGGCGKNCLRSCCIPGAKLPLYAFKKLNNIESEKDVLAIENKEPPVAFLDSLVLGEWEDRMQRGLFRYDVTACETKVIPGEYGFIAQLNEGRHLKKRPTEFRVDKVLQPFDGNKFNFTKVGQEEVLFQFEASEDGEVQFFPNAPIYVENSPSVVAINVSPIEYGHVLLVPRILECLPQRIDRESFLLALYMAAEAGNPYFRLGYNSLGAFATINHLHFQAYYLAVPFPIEKAPTKKLTTLNDGVIISELLKFPVRGLVFEGGNTLQDLSDTVSDACICLQDNNIPYNVLISDCGKRIFLLPQCYAEKQALGEVSPELLDTQVNPAVWEISGHMVLKRRKDYDEASEENAWRLLAEVSLSDERFGEVNALILEAIASGEDGIQNVAETLLEESYTKAQCLEEENAIIDSSHCAMVAGTQECLVLQLLTGEKSLKWEQSKRLSRNGMRCCALEIEYLPAFTMGKKFQLDNVIEAQQFDRDTLSAIFEVAREMENIEKKSPGSQILKDTIRTVEGYSDIIVMRHFESDAARRAAATAGIPIINAGPFRCLHHRKRDRKTGWQQSWDLANGRTIRSLAYLLAKYQDVKIYFVSPDVVKMKDGIKDYLTSRGVEWEESADLMEVTSKCDVVYQTSIQQERFGERIDLYEEARGKYIVDKDVLKVMQKHAVVMHPLPRLDEITVDVDADPRAAYFRQAENGLYIRMALLKLLLIGW
ncbi:hypothetical protein CRYUN_Cryun11dG0016000 [Craigia yunnanensis]